MKLNSTCSNVFPVEKKEEKLRCECNGKSWFQNCKSNWKVKWQLENKI